MTKPADYNVGIYVRLSQEDMRAGESLSIENQKLILTKYVREQGWNLIDIYIDDGYSGTSFDRPAVQKLLDDAKVGIVNLIIVKDLSRFGRNYIEVGRYIDYIFPAYNIRFVALNDNIDTANKDSMAMDMMPIINLFNEWHAASTSKKIKAVIEANAKAGKYRTTFAPFGYIKGDDPNHLPVIDPEAAPIVRRIFEMRAQGISPRHICDTLNDEHIPIPSDYYYQKLGKPNPRKTRHLWRPEALRQLLKNPTYLGNLAQLKTTTVSYKNHKIIHKNPNDYVVVTNTHEPIISQELWDKVREVENSVSRGKRTKSGFIAPLSGLMFCVDCGAKMRLCWNNTTNGSKSVPRKLIRHNFNCDAYIKFGKRACQSHYIKMNDINLIVLTDIRSMAQLVVEDETEARAAFLNKKEQLSSLHFTIEQKKLAESKHRLLELEQLMQSVYEDKVLGKIPESVCINLLEKYEAERAEKIELVADLEERLSLSKKNSDDVDEFIRRLKRYVDIHELTREMCLELIEYITIDAYEKGKTREIHIYYKFIDEPLSERSLKS